MTDKRWKVGVTQATFYGSAQRHGYSFSIQTFHGAPLINITYETREECEQAEAAVRKAIETAVDIIGYNG
jgi:hypothetical protein